MSRKQFVLIFVILVVCFVPILINFGVVGWIVPLAWGIASALKEFSQFDWKPAIGFTLYSLVYTAAFYIQKDRLFIRIRLAMSVLSGNLPPQ